MKPPALSVLGIACLVFLPSRTAPAHENGLPMRIRLAGGAIPAASLEASAGERPSAILLAKKRKKKSTYTGGGGAGARLNINACSRKDLSAYPLIPPETADAIIQQRETGGPLRGPEDLRQLPGGERVLRFYKDLIIFQ